MKPRRLLFRPACLFSTPLNYGTPLALGFAVLITAGLEAHAGDILRGGASQHGAKPRPGAAGGTPTAAATDAARANARDTLARTTRTLDAMRAMQAAARQQAAKAPKPTLRAPTLPAVPNGLRPGGLQISPLAASDPTKWSGASRPTQKISGGKTKVTIKQTEQQALLHWKTFNVGKNTTVTFDQSKGGADSAKWIAFNKVSDPSAQPSRILGNIRADGQVYLINPNGVIFGGSSSVNARGLTVSSLPVNENLIQRGLLNNPDAQFLFSGLDIPAGSNGTPAFTPEKPLSPDGRYGDVVVEKGAVLTSPTNSAKTGGRITLVGPNVTNEGTISTPDGQTILASGLQVAFAAHASSDPSLRGLDPFIGAISDPVAGPYAGTTTQGGIIRAARGNITLAGATVRQNGFLDSSTSVSLNGRIDLLAHYDAIRNPLLDTAGSSGVTPFIYQKSGSIQTGPGSVMRILPEWNSKETSIGSELALRSRVNMAARTIHLGAGSTLLSPNALVNVNAGEWITTGSSSSLTSTFVQSAGQVYLDRGATIDVSGSTNVSAPVSQNIISVDLRGAELANSPLQRNGLLRNATVLVDIRDQGIYRNGPWIGTPLADISGFANLIQKSVGQLTTAGGTVNISAGSSVVMQNGSKVDVSGGTIRFEAGTVKTTQLITQGRLVDISAATPDVIYDGIFDGSFTVNNPKFGITQSFKSALAPEGSRFEQASTQGAAGGSISITAPSMVLDGGLLGRTTTGERQRLSPPARSSLNLAFLSRDTRYQTLPQYAPAPPELIIGNGSRLPDAAPFSLDANGNPAPLAPERIARVELAPDVMSAGGFGILNIDNRDGSITLPENVHLKAPGEGAITFNASNIRIHGRITAAGGELSFISGAIPLETLNLLANSTGGSLPADIAGRGTFELGAKASINTAGRLVDDRLNPDFDGSIPILLNGGSIDIRAYSADLAAGARLDVSGGVAVNPRGAITYGDAGAISIASGRDLSIPAFLGGSLKLNATLAGFSGTSAGRLSIAAPAIQIGGATPASGVTHLNASFFNQGGFGTFSLTSTGLTGANPGEFITGVTIASGTRIHPRVQSWRADTSGSSLKLSPVLLAEGLRPSSNLSFFASGALDPFTSTILGVGHVVLAENASIHTDAKGSVAFSGDTVTLAGTVNAPGGSIHAAGGARYPSNDPDLLVPTTLIGASARLSTAGKLLLVPNPLNLRQGQVLAGGSITLGGNIAAQQGAILDVSGTTGILDLPPSANSLESLTLNSTNGKTLSPVLIDSNGGSITFNASRMLYSEATLIGRKGGTSANGGSVSVSSGRFTPFGTAFNTADPNLIVRQNGLDLPAGLLDTPPGTPLTDAAGQTLEGIGNFSVNRFSSGGFHSLSLLGNVAFEGDVSIRLPGMLRVSSGGTIQTDGSVNLRAGYVQLGQPFATPTLPGEEPILFTRTDASGVTTPYQFDPSFGTGSLSVRAGLIDVGTLSLQNIGLTDLNAANGDIRGNGTLSAAGSLELTAGQIYPTTASRFSVFVYDYSEDGFTAEGAININPGSARPLPLTAGGSLGLFASQINQGGTLRAPAGAIQIGWDGTGTAPANPITGPGGKPPVSALVNLADGGTTSVSAVDPRSGKAWTIPFGISLDGNSWIDPAGTDITLGGLPVKSITIAAAEVTTEPESELDITGGGDLYAYRWISGNGGTRDILSSPDSFAILPGLGSLYAPSAPFNNSSNATNLAGQPGYVNPSLRMGDQVTLAAAAGLPSGTYTLLPARYALLPGAFLVTPVGGTPAGSTRSPDGASIVSGFRSNNLDPSRTGPTSVTRFEVAPAKVFRNRAEYQDLLANTVLRDSAISRGLTPPRLPMDAGYLGFTASAAMNLTGKVNASTTKNGRGGLIDINSASDILINRSGTGGADGQLVLSAALLNTFNAESLLIGGTRTLSTGQTSIAVNTAAITLDNQGAPLVGNDLILTARNSILLEANASIQADTSAPILADPLLIGDDTNPGSGDGVLVRAGRQTSPVLRSGLTSSTTPRLVLRTGAAISGGSLLLDSTSATTLAPDASIQATNVALNSGKITLSLENPGSLPASAGLVLSGETLATLEKSTRELSLLSYSTLDIFGNGSIGSGKLLSLSLQAPSIRGFNAGDASVSFSANTIRIENPSAASQAPSLANLNSGSLVLNAREIILGDNQTAITGYAETNLTASAGIILAGSGSLSTTGDANLLTPVLTGENAARYQIVADGFIQLVRPDIPLQPLAPAGLGASLTLQGSDLQINSDILLPSGSLHLHATGGDLIVGDLSPTRIILDGTEARLLDVSRFTNGGSLTLASDGGSILLAEQSSLSVSGLTNGGDAGEIRLLAPQGAVELLGSIRGSAGQSARQGRFTLDISQLASGTTSPLDEILNQGGFTASRQYRIRGGDVEIDGTATAHHYHLSADNGNLLVSGTINASGNTGGSIDLAAHGSLTLTSGANLDASARNFDSAGKGGSVHLTAGAQRSGLIDPAATLDLGTGATIDLSVASADAASRGLGRFSGTLHLRAPRNAANSDVLINPLAATIRGASAITIEGVKLYDLTGSGEINSSLQSQIFADATAFLGSAGTTTAGYSAMLDRITGPNPSLNPILTPGVEIHNPLGSLTLGSPSSTASDDWNLASFRFGPRSAPGTLTLRAADNLTFHNALSDGFSGGVSSGLTTTTSLWQAVLMDFNPQLPANTQSWTFRLTAGADLSAADHRALRPLASLATDAGILELGKDAGAASVVGGDQAKTSSIIENLFQVIRTGSGEIDIHAARSVRLLNPFASIYTAGTRVADPSSIASPGDFSLPALGATATQGNLGAAQQTYIAQYSMAGGNVSIHAGEHIERKTRNNSGLIDDSSRQLPNNWLYRRGLVGPDGSFGALSVGSGFTATSDPSASTTWWIDFSNFFQSVGTLGGGNINLSADQSITNIDAVIPTNARTARGKPSTAAFLELGGGDLRVSSRGDISGGVFYVERGQGTLEASGSITTNATRSPSFGLVANLNEPDTARLDPLTWMPTTLFLGKSSFDITATGDLLLGPAANPFLLPQGLNNRFWYKTYFSTLSAESSVRAISLGGSLTLRNAVTLPAQSQAQPVLRAWQETQNLFTGSSSSTAWLQPWLRLAETSLTPFSPVWSLTAANLSLTSLAGDLNLTGETTLRPAPAGQLELIAKGSIHGLQPTGLSDVLVQGRSIRSWIPATLNLSDADPRSIPNALSPLTSFTSSAEGPLLTVSNESNPDVLNTLAGLFTESGSVTGINAVLQTRQARHTSGNLHRDDLSPLRIHALEGDLSGITLFSPKNAVITAGNDLTDVSLHIQNLRSSDASVVSAGRDIIASNNASPLRVLASADGNLIPPNQATPAGDIQISGPGTLQVLAGRNLDLGITPSRPDGTGTGITSIGNLRNPYLPAAGANLLVAAGIGPATSLATSSLALEAFISKYINSPDGRKLVEAVAPGIDFAAQPPEEQARIAIEVFHRILRNTGRNYNKPSSPGYRKYDDGFAAIQTLFPKETSWQGEILTQGRDIRTRSGGDISIINPGGGLKMSETTIGNPLTPPGIITESGGNISLFADQSVGIGIGRIFTLRGGDILIWSSKGDIAAGSSSRTVQSAPPTRVVVDPQSAAVETDLAGLATGGGIGVLATVEGISPGDVDLIAPEGVIDAGDAGIRVSGNINLAAVTVVNASNISAGGASTGAPSTTVSAPSISTVTSAASAAVASTAAATNPAGDNAPNATNTPAEEPPSVYTVEVIGYGGGAAPEDEEETEGNEDGPAAGAAQESPPAPAGQ